MAKPYPLKADIICESPPPSLPVGPPPDLRSPPLEAQRARAEAALAEARQLGATEGFLLKNLEKDCECSSLGISTQYTLDVVALFRKCKKSRINHIVK